MLFYFIKHFINEDHLSFWYFLSLFDESAHEIDNMFLNKENEAVIFYDQFFYGPFKCFNINGAKTA